MELVPSLVSTLAAEKEPIDIQVDGDVLISLAELAVAPVT
jgi:hypothetical protein